MILGQHITDTFTQSRDSELGATTGEIFPCFSLNGKGGDFRVILLVNLCSESRENFTKLTAS